jgi:hypothetical protein
VSEAEDLVRRLIDAHNRGGDALLDVYDDLFDPDAEWKPLNVGAVGFPGRATYRGRDGDGKIVRGQAFRSQHDALEAARA